MVKRTTRLALSLGVVAVALSLGGVAVGQETTYTFDEEIIRGTIEKPEAFYILSPSSLDYVSMEAEESFLDALWDTVEEESL